MSQIVCSFSISSQDKLNVKGKLKSQMCYYVSIYKAVIPVCLFVRPIITQEPLDRFVSNFDWGTREAHGNVLSLILIF